MLRFAVRRLGFQQRQPSVALQRPLLVSWFSSESASDHTAPRGDAYDGEVVASSAQHTHTSSSSAAPSSRSPEQKRAAKLEYEGMLRLTKQVLSLEQFTSSNLRDFKLTLNYWTSVRAHHQILLSRDDDDQQPLGQQHAAPRLFKFLMERGYPSFIQKTIKTDDHSMGGLIYLMEHLLFAFRETHQLKLLSNNKQQDHHGRDDLLNTLLQASNVLSTMHRLQTDPDYTDIIGANDDDDDDSAMIDVKLTEANLWSKRVWFLKQFGIDELADKQVELAFGGERTIIDCMTRLTCLVDELVVQEREGEGGIIPHLPKLYNMIISTWVHSGLPESLDVTLDLLNDIEEDARIEELTTVPYNSVMFLCAKQAGNDNAATTANDVARPLWQHMRAPDSSVQPDATTLATLLLCLISSNQLEEAVSVLDEVEGEEGTNAIHTNTTCYNIVLDGLAKSSRGYDAARQAEALLQRMMELSETGVNPWVAPDRISFSTVMEILSKRKGGASKVEAVLVRCKSLAESNKELEPDRIMYNIVLDSYAKQSENERNNKDRRSNPPGPQQAEALLRTMESNPDTLPGTISYNTVLNVFAKSAVSFDRMESILQEMNDKVAEGDDSVKPDIVTYNIILSTLLQVARDGTEESMDKALSFMQEMRDIGMAPDRISYNSLMDAIVKSDRQESATLAERLLENMESDHGIQADATSYNVILNGYAKAGSMEASRHAERILQRMITLFKEGRVDCRPNFVSYASVMDAYARSCALEAGFQAEALLNSMEEIGATPNTICYNAAINCWAKSRHNDAPSRAEDLLNRMAQQEPINPTAKPNSVSFSSVMNCWAQSRQDGAAERTEAILNRMELLVKAGDREMLPNSYAYSTVISAWGKLGRADKALAILNRVEQAFASGRSHVLPNFACYNATMNAIAKSRSENKAEEAAAILGRMKRDFREHGKVDTAPTAISYSSVLNACAYTISNDPQERAKAFRIARETFRDLLQYHKPTPVCYINFLTACGRLLPAGKNRDDMVEAIFRDCQERRLVNDKVARVYHEIVSHRQVATSAANLSASSRPSWRSR